MMDKKSWNFCGIYGDDDQTVHIKKMPGELSEKKQKKLRRLYETRECNHDDDYYSFIKNGLIREVGNAWNKSVIFSPQVHDWMKNTPAENKKIKERLKNRYT